MMNADRGGHPKLTMLPFLIVAMAKTLADYPRSTPPTTMTRS